MTAVTCVQSMGSNARPLSALKTGLPPPATRGPPALASPPPLMVTLESLGLGLGIGLGLGLGIG